MVGRGRTAKDILATSDLSAGLSTVTLAEKSLDPPVFFDASAHSLYHFWNAVVHLADNPLALGLIVLDETSCLPEGLAHLTEKALAANPTSA
jgi:hypothetical protein